MYSRTIYIKYNYIFVHQDLRLSHWKEGETAALKHQSMEEGGDVIEDDDDLDNEEGEHEAARIAIAMLRSGRELNEAEIIE